MEKKRKLPRHVDGRIMIGKIPLKKFLIFSPIALPIGILSLVFTVRLKSPSVLFIGVLILGFLSLFFTEFKNRETGIDILKDIIKYNIEGDKFYERSCLDIATHKRCIRNKIKRG